MLDRQRNLSLLKYELSSNLQAFLKSLEAIIGTLKYFYLKFLLKQETRKFLKLSSQNCNKVYHRLGKAIPWERRDTVARIPC